MAAKKQQTKAKKSTGSKAKPKRPFFSFEQVQAFKAEGHPTFSESSLSLQEARAFAYAAHDGQKDKAGEPYWKHLEGVCQGVVVLGGDTEEQIAALLHDVLEDTSLTRTELRSVGISERAVRVVEAVTKPFNAVQNEYLEGIIKAGPGAMRVKAADLMHNLRHDRMAELPEYTRDRLHKKYRPSLARLLMELELIVDEDAQKKLATKPVGTGGGYTSGWSSGNSPYNHPKRQSLSVRSLLKGDWVTYWKAPIIHVANVGDDYTLVLANGEVKVENHKPNKTISVFPHSAWTKDTTITFAGVTEDDIADFITICEKVMQKKD